MVEAKIKVKNKLGIHARPASLIVQEASKFRSEVMLKRDNLEINAKSIMGVMMLAVPCGEEVLLSVNGSDEQEAMLVIKKLFDDKFYEE